MARCGASSAGSAWAVRPRRSRAQHTKHERVALQAQYVYDTFGKFSATVPSMWVSMYLQAQHLDPEFYDHFYNPGAYLSTHATHGQQWHT